MKKWMHTPWGTEVLINWEQQFYVSYKEHPVANDACETALCWTDDEDRYLILDGDWRREYAERIDSFAKCKELYEENKEDFASVWSDDGW